MRRFAIVLIGASTIFAPVASAVDPNRTVEIDTAAARHLLIDPEQQAIDQKRAKWIDQHDDDCPQLTRKSSFKEIEQFTECQGRLREQAANEYPGRGSPEYSQRVYGEMSREEAQKKANELYKHSFEMRDPSTREERNEPGVVTRSQLRSEVLWLEQNKLGTKVLIGR